MRFNKSGIVKVLITSYLSSVALCHYIPEKKNSEESNKKTEGTSQKDRIRVCGNALTTMIIEACDGIVGSLDQAHFSRETMQTKITEDCCDRECPLDYLQSYCGQTPLFTFKKTVRGRLLNKLNARNRISKGQNHLLSDEKQETKIRGPNERRNNINIRWPSIQIGTISPEIDRFGGQPVVMVKKSNHADRESILN